MMMSLTVIKSHCEKKIKKRMNKMLKRDLLDESGRQVRRSYTREED